MTASDEEDGVTRFEDAAFEVLLLIGVYSGRVKRGLSQN